MEARLAGATAEMEERQAALAAAAAEVGNRHGNRKGTLSRRGTAHHSDMLWYTNVAVPVTQCRYGLLHLRRVIFSKRAQCGTPQVEQARAAVKEREGGIAARAETADREAAQARRATQSDREAMQALQAEFRCGCAVPVSS